MLRNQNNYCFVTHSLKKWYNTSYKDVITMYVKREQCLSKIRRYYDANLIKVLTGIRRCGKSVILEQIKEEVISNGLANVDHVISMNFEDLKFEKYTTTDKLNKAILKNIKDENKINSVFNF